MSKASTEHRGIVAAVAIRDYPEKDGHVEITVTIEPPGRGLDRVAYTRVQAVPKGSGA